MFNTCGINTLFSEYWNSAVNCGTLNTWSVVLENGDKVETKLKKINKVQFLKR